MRRLVLVVGAVALVSACTGTVGDEGVVVPGAPAAGEGWRLLAAWDLGAELLPINGLATTDGQLRALLPEAVDVGGWSTVDFDREVVFRWAEPHGSGCPVLRFDGIDVAENRLDPVIVGPTDRGVCTDDLTGVWVFLVGVERSLLPDPPFAVGGGLPRPENVGMVRVDLSVPGATVPDDDA